MMFKLSSGFILCLTITMISVSCGGKKKDEAAAKKPATPPITKVDGYVVKQSPMSESLEVPGTVLPFEETEIHPEVPGRVVGIYFKEAAMISKGAALVKLYDGDLIAQLNKLKVQLRISEKTFERQNELLKIGGISQQEADLTGLASSNIRADINLIQIEIAKTTIRAPYSGRVGFRNISLGAYISPTTVVTTLNDVNRLKVEFAVPGKYTSVLSPAKPIKFSVEGSPNDYFASISGTENSIADANRSLTIRATVQKTDKYIMPGAFAKIKLAFDENPNAIMIPTNAIIPQARNKQVVVSRDGLASFEVVQTGIRDSANVEITSGLKVGDTVIVSGLLTLKPKARIALNKVQ